MVTTYCIVICSTNGTPGNAVFTFAFSLCKPMSCYPGKPDTAAVSCIHVSFSPAATYSPEIPSNVAIPTAMSCILPSPQAVALLHALLIPSLLALV